MLNATFTYDRATNTVTALDGAGVAAPYYRLVRRRPGRADELLSDIAVAGGIAWKPEADGCPSLVLQSGDYPAYDPDTSPAKGAFVASDESEATPFLLEGRHTESLAYSYGKYAQRHPAGHPLDDVLAVLARRQEGRNMFNEGNDAEADKLLTTTKYPR